MQINNDTITVCNSDMNSKQNITMNGGVTTCLSLAVDILIAHDLVKDRLHECFRRPFKIIVPSGVFTNPKTPDEIATYLQIKDKIVEASDDLTYDFVFRLSDNLQAVVHEGNNKVYMKWVKNLEGTPEDDEDFVKVQQDGLDKEVLSPKLGELTRPVDKSFPSVFFAMEQILMTSNFKLVMDYNANKFLFTVHGSPNDKLSFDQTIKYKNKDVYIRFDEPQVVSKTRYSTQSVRDDLRRNGIEWIGKAHAYEQQADQPYWPWIWTDKATQTSVHYIPADLFTYEIRKAFPKSEQTFRDLFKAVLQQGERPIITSLFLKSSASASELHNSFVSVKRDNDELFAKFNENNDAILRQKHAEIADILGHDRFMISTFKGTFIPGIAMDQYDNDKKIMVDTSFVLDKKMLFIKSLDKKHFFIKFFDTQVHGDGNGDVHKYLRKNNIEWIGRAKLYYKNQARCPIPYWPESWKIDYQSPKTGCPNEFVEYEIHYIPSTFVPWEVRNEVKRDLPNKIRDLVTKAVEKNNKPTLTELYLTYGCKNKDKNKPRDLDETMRSVTVNIKLDELWLSAVVGETETSFETVVEFISRNDRLPVETIPAETTMYKTLLQFVKSFSGVVFYKSSMKKLKQFVNTRNRLPSRSFVGEEEKLHDWLVSYLKLSADL